MKQTDTISTQIAALPISESARREALHYVAVGETIAGFFVFVMAGKWLEASPSLKPAYQD
jgi:hypothetical protein